MFQPIAVCGPGCGSHSTLVAPTHGLFSDERWPSGPGRAVAAGGRAVLDAAGGVVVHAEQRERDLDEVEVAVLHEGPVGDVLGVGEDLLGVLAVEHRAEEDLVGDGVDAALGLDVLRGVGRGARDVQVERHRDRRVLAEHVLDRPAGEAVREVEVVDGGERRRRRRSRRGRARRRRSRGTPSTTARSAWSTGGSGRPAPRPACARTRRTGRRSAGWPSRPRPRAAAAGPSGRASRRA